MKHFFRYLLKHAPFLISLATFIGVVAGILNAVLIALLNQGITQVGHTSGSLVTAFFVLCFLLPMGRLCSQVLLAFIAEKAVYDMSTGLSRQILKAPLRDLENHGANRLLATLTTDISQISTALGAIPFFFMNLAIIVSCIVYLFFLSPLAGTAVLVTIGLGVGAYSLLLRVAMGYLGHARDKQDMLMKHYQALTTGNKELKLHEPRRNGFLEKLAQTAEQVRKSNVRATFWHASGGGMSQFLTFVVIGLLVFTLPLFLADLTPKIVTGYAMVLLYIAMPIDGLIQSITGLARASISARKVEALGLELQNKMVEEQSGTLVEVADWQELCLNNVTHSYYREGEDRDFTMGPLSLRFQPGELVFLVGGNGSGKTTLAKIILGLYPPEKGTIQLNDQPIDHGNRDAYRQMFSAVFVDFFLFEELLGIKPPKVDELATDYLEKLHLSHKVTVEGTRLSTLSLSQGQRKRLALLTAYLEDRPIYVFDEWAADQDPEFKKVFYDVLLPDLKARGKTVLVISHDDQYFYAADRILKMNFGQLEEEPMLVSV